MSAIIKIKTKIIATHQSLQSFVCSDYDKRLVWQIIVFSTTQVLVAVTKLIGYITSNDYCLTKGLL